MLRFEGERDLPLAPGPLWDKLTDARFLVQCLPDVESITTAEADRAALVLRPSLAFVRGSLEITLQVTEKTPPTSARVLVTSRGIGSSSTVEATLGLMPQDTGTRVHWITEVKELGGLLKMVPAGLIRGAAKKVINDVWATVATRLAAPSEPEA